VLDGSKRGPLFIRGEERQRRDLSRVPIVRPGGGTVELAQIADVSAEDGPTQVIREKRQRYVNVRGRDLVGFVADAQVAVNNNVRIPSDYVLDWGGQFENQQRAAARLALRPADCARLDLFVVVSHVRIAAPGDAGVLRRALRHHRGVVALWASGQFLSVPASVGFIALIGIAVLNGVVLITDINASGCHARCAKRCVRRIDPRLNQSRAACIDLRERLPRLNDTRARSFSGLDVGPTRHVITNC